jgi:hypothetical protein
MANKDKVSFDVRGGGKPIPLKRIRTGKPLGTLSILKQLQAVHPVAKDD